MPELTFPVSRPGSGQRAIQALRGDTFRQGLSSARQTRLDAMSSGHEPHADMTAFFTYFVI
jgi:hypothetical protein